MTVVEFAAHRHSEAHSETIYEILILVAVIDEGVGHAHLRSIAEEVQSHSEREPRTCSIRVVILTGEAYANAVGTLLLDGYRIDAPRI